MLSGNSSKCEMITGVILFTVISPFYLIYSGLRTVGESIGILQRPNYEWVEPVVALPGPLETPNQQGGNLVIAEENMNQGKDNTVVE